MTFTTWLVCYDIADPERLRRVSRLVSGFGERLQYSVYRCSLSPTTRQRMLDALAAEIDARADRVLFVSLGPTGGRQVATETLGIPLPPERPPGRIIL